VGMEQQSRRGGRLTAERSAPEALDSQQHAPGRPPAARGGARRHDPIRDVKVSVVGESSSAANTGASAAAGRGVHQHAPARIDDDYEGPASGAGQPASQLRAHEAVVASLRGGPSLSSSSPQQGQGRLVRGGREGVSGTRDRDILFSSGVGSGTGRIVGGGGGAGGGVSGGAASSSHHHSGPTGPLAPVSASSVYSSQAPSRHAAMGAEEERSQAQAELGREVEEQDRLLEGMSRSLERLGEMGNTISAELESQGRVIDEVGATVDMTQAAMDEATRRVQALIKSNGGPRWCGSLVVLSLVLAVLTYIALFT
jgi:hypothetical protein